MMQMGRTALMLALNGGHVEVAQLLVEKGLDPAALLPPPRGWSILYFAISSNSIPAVTFCLEHNVSACRRAAVGL